MISSAVRPRLVTVFLIPGRVSPSSVARRVVTHAVDVSALPMIPRCPASPDISVSNRSTLSITPVRSASSVPKTEFRLSMIALISVSRSASDSGQLRGGTQQVVDRRTHLIALEDLDQAVSTVR